MTDTDILAFLKARLDEDEQIARASARLDGSDWSDHDGPTPRFGVVSGYDGGLCESDAADAHLMHRPTAGHIALHDPSRVLREVAAKQRTLERHEPVEVWNNGGKWVAYTECSTCAEGVGERMAVDWPCPDVRDLASGWSDHPDYNPSWTVE